MNYSELKLAGKCFGSSFYKLGAASASFAYLAYPVSMITLQAGIGYGACIAADTWSNTTCHNILLNSHDAKFASIFCRAFGYNPPAPPEYFSDNIAKVLNVAFSNYSPACYVIGCVALLNPTHVSNFGKSSFNVAKNLTGSVVDVCKGFYHLGKGLAGIGAAKKEVKDKENSYEEVKDKEEENSQIVLDFSGRTDEVIDVFGY
jgi:hypothetical protein